MSSHIFYANNNTANRTIISVESTIHPLYNRNYYDNNHTIILLSFHYIYAGSISTMKISLRLSRNSEAFVSELRDNLEEKLSLYCIYSNIYSSLNFPTTQ